MAEFSDYVLPSGAVLRVQSSLQAPPTVSATGEEAWRVGVPAGKAVAAWNDGLDLVKEVAAGVVEKLSAAASAADQIQVEFGVSLKGKTGIILVEGEAAANLKVTISWKPAPA